MRTIMARCIALRQQFVHCNDVSSQRSSTGQATPSKWEAAVVQELQGRGLSFITTAVIRTDLPKSNGGMRSTTPDILFPDRNLVVFLDGCYWHGCPDHPIRSNIREAKAQKDAELTQSLRRLGWHVLRIWEHDGVEGALHATIQAVKGSWLIAGPPLRWNDVSLDPNFNGAMRS